MKEKDNRIYGIDPGFLENPEAYETMSEIELYWYIDTLSAHIWKTEEDMASGIIPKTDLTEEEYALDYMIYQTNRFGTEITIPKAGKQIILTPAYNAWYGFYSDYFNLVLSDEEWKTFQYAIKNNQDISIFMPTGNWKDIIEKFKI